MKKITIVDYGVGNLHSLKRAVNFLGAAAEISEDAEDILNADALILPGVGSFEAGMRGLRVRGLTKAIQKFAQGERPVLGICLGAQIMLSRGQEFGSHEGLNLISGEVVHFPKLENNEKIPHVGWNKIYPNTKTSWKNSILNSFDAQMEMYFVHSYILKPEKDENILSLTRYGGYEFCSAVKKGNIYGCQFHPEKSGEAGLEILKNFVSI
ncbi:imidazole glycerol phosphate synthase subunit HisH [Candidatus Giovannonibacteria bacterium]|nr:imidazole glycerol phosphate synthase subunit HisH [Candidatus Giovannonibacteria bacterium]